MTEAEIVVMYLEVKKETPGATRSWKRQRSILPEAFRGSPSNNLILGFWPPELSEQICYFRPLALRLICTVAIGNCNTVSEN